MLPFSPSVYNQGSISLAPPLTWSQVFCQPIQLGATIDPPNAVYHASSGSSNASVQDLGQQGSSNLDTACLQAFNWRPDYQGLDLVPLPGWPGNSSSSGASTSGSNESRHSACAPAAGMEDSRAQEGVVVSAAGPWRPLADPQAAMGFDFYSGAPFVHELGSCMPGVRLQHGSVRNE